jgi:hypothetical protein
MFLKYQWFFTFLLKDFFGGWGGRRLEVQGLYHLSFLVYHIGVPLLPRLALDCSPLTFASQAARITRISTTLDLFLR